MGEVFGRVVEGGELLRGVLVICSDSGGNDGVCLALVKLLSVSMLLDQRFQLSFSLLDHLFELLVGRSQREPTTAAGSPI